MINMCCFCTGEFTIQSKTLEAESRRNYMDSSDLRPPKHKTTRKKMTRELPNLSDCHACERRANNTIPSDRLRILNSHWRIVLLCRSCYNLVESAKLCSYCLNELGESASVHHCRSCCRQVHRDCVSRYSGFAPFSYLSSAADLGSSGFSICIDCWVPRLVDSKLRGSGCSPGISRVSDGHERPKSVEEVANDANCLVRKKSLIAEIVREKAMMKGEVVREAVELANNGPLDLVCAGEEDNKCSDDACELVDCYDKKMALQLHRVMNSSPRISRSLNLSCTKSMEVLKLNDEFSAGDLSRLDYNMNTLESQGQMETSSIKSRNVGSEDNSVNVESHSCDRKYVVVFGLKHNGNFRPEFDRFSRKYSRRSSSKRSEHESAYDKYIKGSNAP